MRHDDMLRTAVALAAKDSPDAQAAALRQLVDLSLQDRDCSDVRLRWRALRALRRLWPTAPASLRNGLIDKSAQEGARSLHLRLFRHEVSHHYDRLLQLARLDEPEWWRLARRAPQHLHAGMLARRDLPAPVRDLLTMQRTGTAARDLFVPDPTLSQSAGSVTDKALFAPPPIASTQETGATPGITKGSSQVRELIERIAAFRNRTDNDAQQPDATAPAATDAVVAPRWTWRCDEHGVLVESPDMPTHLQGQWLTEFETPESPRQLQRAFERRVPFRDMTATGRRDVLPGRWRLSGLPQFDRRSGRFTGYWGSAIALDKPVSAAHPETQAAGIFGTGASGEALATMAHEVRTPLNAIIGFAQLIEGEILGEAGTAYREQAGNILRQAEKLLDAFDDLSDAARIEQGRFAIGTRQFDAGLLAGEVIRRYASLAEDREVTFVPVIAADLASVHSDESVFERALSRLLTAALASATPGEAILVVVMRAPQDQLRVVISRPRAMLGRSDEDLLDPAGSGIAGSGGAILGIGFGLKLVASLAGTVGGKFLLNPHVLELIIPAAPEMRDSEAS